MTANRNGIYTGKANSIISSTEVGIDRGKGRTLKELRNAESEFYEKVWYVRHQCMKHTSQDGRISQNPTIIADAEADAKRIERTYGNVEEWYPQTAYEVGFLEGTLSALRWAMGYHWGFLDT